MLGVVPAHQSLDPDHPSGGQLDLRLIDQRQLTLFDCGSQRSDQGQPPGAVLVALGGVDLDVGVTRLGLVHGNVGALQEQLRVAAVVRAEGDPDASGHREFELLDGKRLPVHQVLNWVWPPAMLVLAVWMLVCVHRWLQSRGGRWLLYPVIVVLALASIGGGYRTLGAAADAKAYPMPGRLIDVGGHSLHLSCTGAGSPTVVLEPAAGEMSSNLGWIPPAVARGTRVCVYDRVGRGWSEPADTAQDGAHIATDLHTLLQRGHVPGPYVLAGHSFGGLYVLTFAARYPDEVAGMVLVDSTAPASAANPGTPSPGHGGSNDAMSRVSALYSTAARLGLARLTPSSPGAACRRGPGTRYAPATRPQARFAARSTSTPKRRPRPSKLPPSVTSPTSP